MGTSKDKELFPQLKAVYLQTAVFGWPLFSCLPGQQRPSVCLPRPPHRLHLWPPPRPNACANRLALCRGSSHMESEQTPLQISGSSGGSGRGGIQLWGRPAFVKQGKRVLSHPRCLTLTTLSTRTPIPHLRVKVQRWAWSSSISAEDLGLQVPLN